MRGEIDDGLRADHGGEALDGVERTEEIANRPRVRLSLREGLVEGEEVLSRRAQVLLGLCQEAGEEFPDIEGLLMMPRARPMQSARTSRSRASGANGLVMNREAPTSSARVRKHRRARRHDEDGQFAQTILGADELHDSMRRCRACSGRGSPDRTSSATAARWPRARSRVRKGNALLGAQARRDHLAHHFAVVDEQDVRLAWGPSTLGVVHHCQRKLVFCCLTSTHCVRLDAGPMTDGALARRTIFVVDDSALDRERACTALQGEYAIEAFATAPPCWSGSPPDRLRTW